MTNPIGGIPPVSSGRPYLNGSQRERVARAREIAGTGTMAIAAGEPYSFASAYTIGVMRSNILRLLEVIDELTDDAPAPAHDANARMVRDVRRALAMLTWDLAGHTISPTSESPQRVLKAIERIVGGER